jgi:hypothetical protein
MADISIACTFTDCYRDVTGLPRLGGPASPWRVFQAQIDKEKEVTDIIADNQILLLGF